MWEGGGPGRQGTLEALGQHRSLELIPREIGF